jgi:hypothetical protein
MFLVAMAQWRQPQPSNNLHDIALHGLFDGFDRQVAVLVCVLRVFVRGSTTNPHHQTIYTTAAPCNLRTVDSEAQLL